MSAALSKSIGCTTDGKILMSQERIQFLNNVIKGNNSINNILETMDINNNEKETEPLADDLSKYEIDDSSDWVKWSNSVLNPAKQITKD